MKERKKDGLIDTQKHNKMAIARKRRKFCESNTQNSLNKKEEWAIEVYFRFIASSEEYKVWGKIWSSSRGPLAGYKWVYLALSSSVD